MTKKQQAMYDRLTMSTATELRDVYGSWSWAKEKALDWCKNKMLGMGGWGLRITSANTFGFCCAWFFNDIDGTLCVNYETPKNTYVFKID